MKTKKNEKQNIGDQVRKLLKESNKYSEILEPLIEGYVKTCAVRDRLSEDIETYGAVLEERRGENVTYKANPAITGFNNASKEARQALTSLGMDSKGIGSLEGDAVDLLTKRLMELE